jgi:ABC-type phosphate transport system auxiliary subunit
MSIHRHTLGFMESKFTTNNPNSLLLPDEFSWVLEREYCFNQMEKGLYKTHNKEIEQLYLRIEKLNKNKKYITDDEYKIKIGQIYVEIELKKKELDKNIEKFKTNKLQQTNLQIELETKKKELDKNIEKITSQQKELELKEQEILLQQKELELKEQVFQDKLDSDIQLI